MAVNPQIKVWSVCETCASLTTDMTSHLAWHKAQSDKDAAQDGVLERLRTLLNTLLPLGLRL